MFSKKVSCPGCGKPASQGSERDIVCLHCGYGLKKDEHDIVSFSLDATEGLSFLLFVPHPDGPAKCDDTRRAMDFFRVFRVEVLLEWPNTPEASDVFNEARRNGSFGHEERKDSGYPQLYVLNAEGKPVWACCEPSNAQLGEAAKLREAETLAEVIGNLAGR